MSSYSNTQSRLERVAPQLRPAGIHGKFGEPTTAELLSSYNPDGRTTPDNIRTFQHRGADVGEATRPWGRTKDAPVDPDVRHGVKAEATAGGADACLRPEMYADKMTALLDAQRETQYLSNRHKPLGHAPVPETPVPVPLHGFGITQPKGDSTQAILAGYRGVDVTHPAGEQTSRNYNWEAHNIDPAQHRFGRASETSTSTTASTLQNDGATQLRSKLASDYHSTVTHELGKPKSYGFDDPAAWDAKKRGRAANVGGNGKAASHFQTEQPPVQEVLSSWAVTRSIGVDRRADQEGGGGGGANATESGKGSEGVVGGAEASRRLRDDVRSHQLLYPCHYISLGVESKYFAGGRSLEDVRQLCHKCDFGLSDTNIDRLFAEVSKDGKCSIEEFKNAAQKKGLI